MPDNDVLSSLQGKKDLNARDVRVPEHSKIIRIFYSKLGLSELNIPNIGVIQRMWHRT